MSVIFTGSEWNLIGEWIQVILLKLQNGDQTNERSEDWNLLVMLN
jgi:hypothetical protein